MMLLTLVACGDPDPGTENLDLRLQPGDYPDPGEDGVVLLGPDQVIQPGSDKMFCMFGTWDGDDVGIHAMATYQNAFGHHMVVMGTTAGTDAYPDGDVEDCSSDGTVDMADLEALMLPTDVRVGDEDRDLGIELPDGMAVKLDAGQRYVVQTHYLNTGTEPIRVQDAAVLTLLPEDEVETWAAPLILNGAGFSLPAGVDTTYTFDCEAPSDLNVLYWFGHMHEWGTSFSLAQLAEDGTPNTVYQVPAWDAEYRDAPPITAYNPGEYLLPTGATMRTTCTWTNDTGSALEFPQEMCVSVAIVYPHVTSIVCDG